MHTQALGSVKGHAGIPQIAKTLGTKDHLIPLDIRLVNQDVAGVWNNAPYGWGEPLSQNMVMHYWRDQESLRDYKGDGWRYDRVYLSPQRVKAFIEKSGIVWTYDGPALAGGTNACLEFAWLFEDDTKVLDRNFVAPVAETVCGFQFRLDDRELPVLHEDHAPLHLSKGYLLSFSYRMTLQNKTNSFVPILKWNNCQDLRHNTMYHLLMNLHDIATQA